MAERQLKIALVSHSLSAGGAERFSALLGRMLDAEGFDIHNITITDAVDYPYAGKLVNLGDIPGGGFRRRVAKAIKLRRYLRDEQIDVVIDNRARGGLLREILFRLAYGRCRKIYVVHSYRLERYFPKSRRLARWLYADATLIAVSKAISDAIRESYDLPSTVIYNPAVPFEGTAAERPDGNYILYFGRFDDSVKNFRLMIDAYAKSGIQSMGYKLVLMGDGPDRDCILRYADEAGVGGHVTLLPFAANPSDVVRGARFTVLTSRFEGFPMSVVESLMLGTPVVSVDCKSGPSELIKDRKNGLLVPNDDAGALAESFKIFVHDAELYHICRTNTTGSVAHLSVENTVKLWKQTLPNPE